MKKNVPIHREGLVCQLNGNCTVGLRPGIFINFLEKLWAKVTQFDSMNESYENIFHSNCYDSNSKSNSEHSSFAYFLSLSEPNRYNSYIHKNTN